MNDWFADGALADYCVASAGFLAPKPEAVSFTAAAAVPIGALTAWQSLFDHAHINPGERVLIQGGAGAVGSFAVQMAHRHGAHVIATASAANLEFVFELGADQVVDYRNARFEDAGPVDVVFDTVGGEALDRSWTVLKPSGRLVTVASAAANSPDPRVKKAFFIVEARPEQLIRIGGMIEDGILRVIVDGVFPLASAPDAFAGKIPRSGQGKVVIAMDK